MAALIFRKGAYYPGVTQSITTSGSSQSFAPFSANVAIVRVATSQDIFLQVGVSPVATTSSMLLPGGAIEFFAVEPGQSIAVLQITTAGIVTVTELVWHFTYALVEI